MPRCEYESQVKIQYALQHLWGTEKTGPEAGQYFHVRPPIGFI